MIEEQFICLSAITFSLLIGFILGAIFCIIYNQKENKELQNEVDKFRDLYFEELDKWRNKYVDNDDYEAY